MEDVCFVHYVTQPIILVVFIRSCLPFKAIALWTVFVCLICSYKKIVGFNYISKAIWTQYLSIIHQHHHQGNNKDVD